MTNSIILQNLTPEQLKETFREVVLEVLAKLEPSKTENKYLTRKEVSKLLKISLPTLNEYTKKGVIKGSRVGSRILYSETELEQAVKDIPNQRYRRSK